MKMQRLKTIINFIDHNSIVADIGTDHGVVPIYLVEENIAKKVIATDISKPSLEKLKNKLQDKSGSLNIETRCSDGLESILPFEVDTIVISGMGGVLIEEILSHSINIAKTANRIILQPNNGADHLRRWLLNNGFYIVEEKDLYENKKYYTVLSVQTGIERTYSDKEYLYGRRLIESQSPVLFQYLKSLQKEKEIILSKLIKVGSSSAETRIDELKKEIKEIEEVLENYDT